MGICRKKFIWSNLQVLLLRGVFWIGMSSSQIFIWSQTVSQAWFGKFSSVVKKFGMTRSEADHSVFYRHSNAGCIYLVVYVDDIVLTGSDHHGISQLKQHICHHFQTKDLGKLRYFMGIEVAQSNHGIVISQRKYALDLLEEIGLLNSKSVETPIDPNAKLLPSQGELLSDPKKYRRLVGKLNYLTLTRPDISFAVSVVSQFLNSPVLII